MKRPIALAIEAELENLRHVQAMVEEFAQKEALSGKSSYALSLCLEELLTNIVLYGQREKDDKTSIAVSIGISGDEVLVHIDDDGPPYDPTETPEPDLDALLDDRPIGGLGVHLVRELARRFEYRHSKGKNRVHIALPRHAKEES